MAQYNDIFKRKEIKFLLDSEQYRLLRERLAGIAEVDAYGRTSINNVYFDTEDRLLIRESLDKPSYKEKLRLRSYGIPEKDSDVFIEIKKKYDGIVYKRRIAVPYAEAFACLYRHEALPEEHSSQISREIRYMTRCYGPLIPSMRISYERIAMAGVKDPNLRITFDSDIRWSTESLTLADEYGSMPILETGQRLMELKIAGAYPLEIAHILGDLDIYPVSFSKYGRGYIQLAAQQKQNTISIYSYAGRTEPVRKGVRYA